MKKVRNGSVSRKVNFAGCKGTVHTERSRKEEGCTARIEPAAPSPKRNESAKGAESGGGDTPPSLQQKLWM